MLKGLEEIKRKTKEIQNISSQDRISTLILSNGESAMIRFLTDGTEVIAAPFHTVEEITPQGKRFRKRYCTFEDKGICQYCAQGLRPRRLIFLWAYVYHIFHKNQNPNLQNDINAPKWQQVKIGGKIFYREDINKPMIFRTTPGKDDVIKNSIVQYYEEYGTLCDRDYKWSRVGEGLNTTYSLVPRDPSNLSKDIENIKDNLPDLAEVVKGNITSFSSSNNAKKEEMEIVSESSSDYDEELF